MRDYIESRQDQFIHDLETIVNIDSGSRCPEGLTAVARFFEKRFSQLGWPTVLHEFNQGQTPCLEVANIADAGDGFEFLFLGHMDTVFGAGTTAQRPFSTSGQNAYGPGVVDMKGGLVTALHVAQTLQHFGIDRQVPLCIAFNSDEEIGSKVSRPWIEKLAAKSRRVMVLEPCRATGHRVLERKGGGGFRVICHGKAAHAGVEPQKGANAVVELAHQILAITPQARPEEGTTISATTITGGTAGNVIPDYAQAGFDVRVATTAEARRVEQLFKDCAGNPQIDGVTITVEGALSRLPMVPNEHTLTLWERIAEIGRGVGLEMKLIPTGGGSDGNFTAAMGIPTVDAMGPRGGNAHSTDEFLQLDSVAANTHLICEIIKAAGEGQLP